jgi:hypothetical protein
MANFKNLTRYTNGFTFKDREGRDFLVLRQSLDLEPGDDDILISVDQNILLRPDLISSKAYDSPELWWAIYEFNGIKDPLFELRIGQILRIPNKDRLIAAINRLNT